MDDQVHSGNQDPMTEIEERVEETASLPTESISSRRIRIRREEQQREAALRAAVTRPREAPPARDGAMNRTGDPVEVDAAGEDGEVGGSGVFGPDSSGHGASANRVRKLTKAEGTSAVKNTVNAMNKGEETAYTLIPYYEWQAKTSGGQRADSATRKLDGFHILCPSNTLSDTGIRVCSSYLTGSCRLEKAIFLFSTVVGGTSTFEKHTKLHGPGAAASAAVMTLPRAQKSVLADAAATACVMSQFPFNFTESPGLVHFANVLFRLGQQCAPADKYDMAESLPKSTCVTTSLAKLADEARLQFVKEEYPSQLGAVGACTTDGLKSKTTGRKFYDLCMLYLVEVPRGRMQRSDIVMKSRILLMEEHFGPEDASSIRRTLTEALLKKYKLDFRSLSNTFCFVTDRASTMPNVVGASVSKNVVAYGERWSWCCAHYINTIMKSTLAKQDVTDEGDSAVLKVIQSNLKSAKAIVRIFKQGNWNAEMPSGCNLLQEVETRFATSWTLCERFVKCPDAIECVVLNHPSHESVYNEWSSLEMTRKEETDEIENLPALKAIVRVFKPLVHVQTLLESDQTPTLHLIVPFFEGIKAQLSEYATSDLYDTFVRTLAKLTLQAVEDMEDHPLHAAATRLVPSLKNFDFVPSSARRETLTLTGDKQIRKLMSQTYARKSTKHGDDGNTGRPRSSESSASTVPQKRDFSSFMSLSKISDARRDVSESAEDELTRYLSNQHLVEAFLTEYDVDRPLDAPLFWLHRKSTFPELAEVAMRLFSIPASSATSERTFSEVSLVSSSRRSAMTSSNLGDCVVAKSALSSGVRFG